MVFKKYTECFKNARLIKCYMRILLLKSVAIFFVSIVNGLAIAQTIKAPNAVSFYGISSHSDNNNGEGYNEKNWGLAVKWTDEPRDQKFYTSYEIGIFENSYYDKTIWVAVGLSYEVSSLIDLGVNFRHWQTEKGTYQNRLIVPYPVVKMKIFKNFSLNLLTRKAGNIAFIDYEF